MYARSIKDQTITLAVSGMLWSRSLVMVDSETGSLWSHLLGEAMHGKLLGEHLEQLPAIMTDWQTWRATHPKTTVLNMTPTTQMFRREIYQNPDRYVVGIVEGERARAWPYGQHHKQAIVNDQFGQRPLVVVFEPKSSTAFLYERKTGDQTLTFELREDKLVDRQTGSEWDVRTGQSSNGSLKGTQLKPALGIVSFRNTWEVFHPESEYWEAER